MKKRLFIWVISFLYFIETFGCDKPQDNPSEDAWIILWANESGNDPSGGVGINYQGWKNFFDDQVGYKIDWDYRQSAPPNSNTLTLETPDKFYSSVYTFVANFYVGQQINPNDVNANKTSLLFGIQNISYASTRVGVTSKRGAISQGVAVSFVFTFIILNGNSSAENGWAQVDYTVLHELGHGRGLNALTDNGEFYDHLHHVGTDLASCVMWDPLPAVPRQPFKFCGYHRKVLKDCLGAIQSTYSPSASCATN